MNTTVTNNFSIDHGGGMFIYNKATLINCTVTQNKTNNNGGGFAMQTDTVNVINTIISGSIEKTPETSDISRFGGILNVTNSIIGKTEASAFNGVKINVLNVDPLLLELEDNGGPTKTHALQNNSPAINAGVSGLPYIPTTDQRGIAVTSSRDIGAFESDVIATSIYKPSDVSINYAYPNPSKGVFYMKDVEGKVSILNMQGALVAERNISIGELLNLTELPKGIYMIKHLSDKNVLAFEKNYNRIDF
ncbi:choice-of-anchor Q domain-containing protein [Sporocytophaga myxococcoides]|uniref:choice-of-anchor Q domain-containing protein n=1 Tax=Sporocytophaga myxococcoides TaxID=153721 RepID=UPI0018CF5598|nr:choice-of-anchor Q domain-containing protein [Sporocytophaga myxococcoides]